MKHIKGYTHIIWDWNGTLLDDLELCVSLINKILNERELPTLSIAQYQDIFTFPVEAYYRKTGLTFQTESFVLVGKQWMEGYESLKHTCSLMKEAKNILNTLHDDNIKQSILSAYSQETLIEIIKSHDIFEYFEHIKGLDHIYATGKVALAKELMSMINSKPEKVLLIGDTLHDKEVADEIGVDCVLIARGHQSYDRLKTSGASVFHSLGEILDLV